LDPKLLSCVVAYIHAEAQVNTISFSTLGYKTKLKYGWRIIFLLKYFVVKGKLQKWAGHELGWLQKFHGPTACMHTIIQLFKSIQ
jgi:hypothetical protein